MKARGTDEVSGTGTASASAPPVPALPRQRQPIPPGAAAAAALGTMGRVERPAAKPRRRHRRHAWQLAGDDGRHLVKVCTVCGRRRPLTSRVGPAASAGTDHTLQTFRL